MGQERYSSFGELSEDASWMAYIAWAERDFGALRGNLEENSHRTFYCLSLDLLSSSCDLLEIEL